MTSEIPPVHLLLVGADDAQHHLLDAALARTRLPYRLERSAGRDEALDRLGDPAIDLYLLDVPDESALPTEFIDEAHRRGIDTPVIVLTVDGAPVWPADMDQPAPTHGARFDSLRREHIEPELHERTIRHALERTIRHALERHRILDQLRRTEGNLRSVSAHADAERQSLLAIAERERSRVAQLVDSLPVVIWESVTDENGALRQSYVTEYIDKLTGYTAEEWIADPELWLRLVHPDDLDKIEVPAEELEKAGEAQRRYRIIRRNGSIAWIDVRFSQMYDADGQPFGLRGIALDVTAKKRIEEALERSERLFESFMDHSPILNFIKDHRGRYLFANSAFARLVERDSERIVGLADIELFPEAIALAFRENDLEVIAADRAVEFTERVDDHGREVISHVIKFPIHTRDGATLLGGIAVDITERIRAEEELMRREEEYRRIVETAQEGIWVTDRTGVTTFVNATMARLVGSTIEQMLGTKFEEYLDEEAREFARANVARRERGLAEKYDLQMRRKDGTTIWTIVSANPIFDREGSLVGSLAMVTDITARRSAEVALREANDGLELRVQERTAELAAVVNELEQAHSAQKRFVADASHDLRTPLTVVRAELDLLLASESLDDATRSSLHRALKEVHRLDQLASDLLLLATLDNRHDIQGDERVRLDELVLECVSNLTALARAKQIRWSIDIDDAVEIPCHRQSLQRAIGNVLDNALKYSPRDAVVGLHVARCDEHVRISVTDSGIGIPAEDLPRIYDRFYRSDLARSTPGTGLGLPIVKHVVEAHGGTVDVVSDRGAGTSVTITLPCRSQLSSVG